MPEDLDGFDDMATAFLDEQLLTAIDTVDMQLQQEVRQIVMVGCGLDTRPFRFTTSMAHARPSAALHLPMVPCKHL